jgi:hypothetical protein
MHPKYGATRSMIFLDRVQFRAARTVLDVGKRAPLPYLAGDTCLLDVQSRHHTYMIRLWTRIISMSRNRIPKKFIYGTEKAPRKIVGRQK